MAAIPPYWAPSFSVWKNRLEDPDTDEGRAFLRERSPLAHIDRAFRPILIVQGLEDVRVTRAESEQMVAVLRRRNVPVTHVVFPDEGHGFAKPQRTRSRSARSPRHSSPSTSAAPPSRSTARATSPAHP